MYSFEEIAEEKRKLLTDLLYFTRVFFRLRTGREFQLSYPISRESHFITISRELTNVFDGKLQNLLINIAPRYAKTELVIHFIAWSLANYPDSNFIYSSYSHILSKKQTQTVRQILMLPIYRAMFGVEITSETSAKDNFETTAGGSVYGVGAGGTITGRGAGIKGVERFGGAYIFDDIHKPDEALSDTMREGVIDWFYNTAQSRINNPNTPFIGIGQRVHEDDLMGHLKKQDWNCLSLPCLDIHNNALYPEMHTTQALLKMKEDNPYIFAAQYQQDPQPAGGGLFKPEWFHMLDEEPEVITTFITADTAETEKDYNDATVFSFWGLYKARHLDVETEIYALHWIDCVELRVEPKDLQNEFMSFLSACMRYKVPPKLIAIEKKSTGVTLLSVIQGFQGFQVIDMVSNGSRQASKIDRFLNSQSYVAQGLISLPKYGRHTRMCIEHCRKITANNSHRFDDIADTLSDAVKIAFIDQTMLHYLPKPSRQIDLASSLHSQVTALELAKRGRNNNFW